MTHENGGDERRSDALAPVIPLFAEREPTTRAAAAWDRTWVDDTADAATDGAAASDLPAGGEEEAAENALMRKLRTRQLSLSEARRVLRDRDLDDGAADDVLERLQRRGYLDDARLAEQLAFAGVNRKGQGRRAVALALTARGIPRDVADATIADLPDDDDERALEVARSRAHRVGHDREAALRRLVGQLTRRGFSSSVAMSAARTALDERR